jgi:anaerobic ribonucleoside-triphosphate reductase
VKQIPVECYDRTVGYFSTTDRMNKGKQEEVSSRKRYNLKIEEEVKENGISK